MHRTKTTASTQNNAFWSRECFLSIFFILYCVANENILSMSPSGDLIKPHAACTHLTFGHSFSALCFIFELFTNYIKPWFIGKIITSKTLLLITWLKKKLFTSPPIFDKRGWEPSTKINSFTWLEHKHTHLHCTGGTNHIKK